MFVKYKKSYITRELADWAMNGCPLPAPHPIKVLYLAQIAVLSGVKRFIETGTLAGNTSGMMALLDGMKVDTIEITDHYFNLAKDNFDGHPNVTQHLGDSGVVLPKLVKEANEPAMFWLDAHCSGGNTGQSELKSPIIKEMEGILGDLKHKHIIAIDDARSFNGHGHGYPEVNAFCADMEKAIPSYKSLVKNDMIILAPREFIEELKANRFEVNTFPLINQQA